MFHIGIRPSKIEKPYKQGENREVKEYYEWELVDEIVQKQARLCGK